MKKIMLFYLVLWLSPWSVLADNSPLFSEMIVGYELEQFLVNSDVQVIADEVINDLIGISEENDGEEVLQLSIVGFFSAEKLFGVSENLASRRAIDMARYMSKALPPLVKVSFCSMKSFDDKSGVEIALRTAQEQVIVEELDLTVYTVSLFVFFLFLFLLIHWRRKSRQEEEQEQEQETVGEDVQIIQTWPCDYLFLFKMMSEKLYSRDVNFCPYCQALVSGRAYVRHLCKCNHESNELFDETYNQAKKIIQERKDEK